MQPIQYTLHGNAVILETPGGFLELTPYSDSIIRVRYAPTQAFSTKASLIVQSSLDTSIDFDISETAETLTVATAKLSIRINRRTESE